MYTVAEGTGSRGKARAEDVVVAPKGEREGGRGCEVSSQGLSAEVHGRRTHWLQRMDGARQSLWPSGKGC